MINKKVIYNWLVIFFLVCSLFPISNNSIVADVSISNVDIEKFVTVLIDDYMDYENAGYSLDRIVDPVLYHNQVLAEGHLPIVLDIDIKEAIDLLSSDKNSFVVSDEIGKKGYGDITYKYRILMLENFNREVPIFLEEPVSIHDKNNDTWNNYTRHEFDGYELVQDYRYVWKDIKDITKIELKTKNKLIIDVQGNFKAGIGSREVDIVPTITIGEYVNTLDQYAWWDSSWSYVKAISVDHTKVAVAVKDFPLWINSTDAAFIAECKANGEDIRFLSIDNTTEFAYEIEEWTSTGFEIWVNITETITSASDYTLLCYYGNAAANDNQDVLGTWGVDAERIYHMNDTTSRHLHDSAGSAPHLRRATDEPSNREAGQIGWTVRFDGVDDESTSALTDINDDSYGTWEVWVNLIDELNDEQDIMSIQHNTYADRFRLIWHTGQDYFKAQHFVDGARQWELNTPVNSADGEVGSWTHIVLVMIDGGDPDLYVNGESQATNLTWQGVDKDDWIVDVVGGGADLFKMGQLEENANRYFHWDGDIDELRIFDTAKTSAWINLSYQSTKDNTFIMWGQQEEEHANNPPTVNTPVPSDTETGVELGATLSINIVDPDGDNMNVSWWSDSEGTWARFDVDYTQSNGTITATNAANFSDYETTYNWNVTVTDVNGGEVISATYTFTTIDNYAPEPSNPNPASGSTGLSVNPTLEIDVVDQEGDAFDIIWWSNSSGSWAIFGTTVGVNNGTHTKAASNFSAVDTLYYWNVTANDSLDENTSSMYNLTTADKFAPTITMDSPGNGAVDQERPTLTTVTLTDFEGDTMNLTWQSNSSGSWITWGTNLSLSNGTFSDTNSNFSVSNTTYWWRVNASDGTYSNLSAVWYFTTFEGVDKPTGTTAICENSTNQIYINFTKGTNTTHTRIQRKTGSYPTSYSDGTNVYNGTGTQEIDSPVASIKYFYSLWGFSSVLHEFSLVNVNITATTKPTAPTLTVTTINNNSINITWVKGIGANTTLVKYSTGTYPMAPASGTELSNDSSTGQTLDGLSESTTYYFTAWSHNTTIDLYSEFAQASNTTGSQPSNVTNLTVVSYNSDQLNLSWTCGNGTRTVIRSNETTYPGDPTSGQAVYNGTGTSYINTSLNSSTKYYYATWSYNAGVFSPGSNNANNSTRPVGITGAGGLQDATTNLNITWNALSVGVDNVSIRRKASSYPQNITDGTEVYNGSALFYNDTAYTDGDKYTIWTYNSTYNNYGEDDVGHHLTWGGLTVNVYSENGTALGTWNISIINEDSTPPLLEHNAQTNPSSYDIDTLPNGEKTTIRISSAGFDSRSYYMDIYENEQYNLNAYLPDEVDSNLYYFIVLNEWDDPVEDCKVTVKRSISGFLREVSVLYTDAAGSGNIHLESNGQYLVALSKEGYATPDSAEWIADPDYYGAYRDYWKVFRIEYSTGDPTFESFVDYCYFEASMNSTGHINITFTDIDSNTTNTAIVVYEHSNYSRTPVEWYNDTNNYNFFQVYAGDTEKEYRIVLHLNHSRLGYRVQWRTINPQHDPEWNEDAIDKKFDDVFGTFELGWTKFFVIFLPCLMFLVAFGANHTGISLMGVGAWLTFSSWFINVNSAATYTAMAGMIILLGIVTIITKKGRKAT